MRQVTNEVLIGKNAQIFVNGKLISNYINFEVKLTGDFEEVPTINSYGKHYVYTGYSGEGTLSMTKTDSDMVSLISESFFTGVFPEVTIFAEIQNKSTGKKEKYMLKDVLFKEVALAKWQNGGKIEEEFPFSVSYVEVIETI